MWAKRYGYTDELISHSMGHATVAYTQPPPGLHLVEGARQNAFVDARRTSSFMEKTVLTGKFWARSAAPTRLVLICELPASGESTLSCRLALARCAVRLDKDELGDSAGRRFVA
jgi:hypothetical protein